MIMNHQVPVDQWAINHIRFLTLDSLIILNDIG